MHVERGDTGGQPPHRVALARLEAGLARVASGETGARDLVAELGPAFFDLEPGWRRRFEALAADASQPDKLVVLALQGYARALREVADPLDAHRRPRDRSPEPERAPPSPHSSTGAPRVPDGLRPLGPGSDFTRLPPGERVRLSPPGDGAVAIWLASQPFEFRPGPAPLLVDPVARRYALREGVNTVGRALRNDAVVSAEHVDVSRNHAILEVSDGRLVAITDLSSRGTFVPRAALSP